MLDAINPLIGIRTLRNVLHVRLMNLGIHQLIHVHAAQNQDQWSMVLAHVLLQPMFGTQYQKHVVVL